jgi:hypothetical protein
MRNPTELVYVFADIFQRTGAVPMQQGAAR